MTTCPNGHENPSNQRFCGECGVRLQTADTQASAEPESVEQPDYRRFVIAAIAASVSIMVGSVGQWVTAGIFAVNGLDSGKWGIAALTLGAVSCVAMVVEFFWSRTRFNQRWAVPLAWAAAVAGVACVSYAVPFLIRVMTLPKASFFGVPMGAAAGWGLWLLALSAAVMCVAASVVATQIARSIDVRSNASWITGWRWAAIVASAGVAISAVVYFSVNWEGSSGGSEASPTVMPSFPSLPTFPSFPTLSFPSLSNLSTTPDEEPTISASTSTQAQTNDYTKLLIKASDINAPEPFTASPPISNPNGQLGATTTFSDPDRSHVITDTIQILLDPAAAANALDAAKQAQSQSLGGRPVPIYIGAGGTTISGSSPDGSKGVTVLLFAEGKALATLEFDGPPYALAPPDFVADIGRKQDAAIKKGLTG